MSATSPWRCGFTPSRPRTAISKPMRMLRVRGAMIAQQKTTVGLAKPGPKMPYARCRRTGAIGGQADTALARSNRHL